MKHATTFGNKWLNKKCKISYKKIMTSCVSWKINGGQVVESNKDFILFVIIPKKEKRVFGRNMTPALP